MAEEISLHLKVRQIINKYDPIHLIDIGCPEDEYDGEVKRILKGLRKVSNPRQLLDLVHGIFVKMFDERLAGPKKNYQQLATDLYQLK